MLTHAWGDRAMTLEHTGRSTWRRLDKSSGPISWTKTAVAAGLAILLLGPPCIVRIRAGCSYTEKPASGVFLFLDNFCLDRQGGTKWLEFDRVLAL